MPQRKVKSLDKLHKLFTDKGYLQEGSGYIEGTHRCYINGKMLSLAGTTIDIVNVNCGPFDHYTIRGARWDWIEEWFDTNPIWLPLKDK